MAADLADPASLERLPAKLDFIFYTAGADGSTDAAYRKAYVDGIRNLITALRSQQQEPRRVVFTSSTAVYGQSAGEWVDESSPTEPQSFAGRRVLEGERVLLGSEFTTSVVRLGGIYGPGRDRLIQQVQSGEAVCAKGLPEYSNRIHRDDCAGILAHLLALPQADGVYVGVDREPADRCEVLRWLARKLGAPFPQTSSSASSRTRRRGSNKRCCSDRIVAAGYRLLYPTFREGFGMLLAQKDQG